MSKTVSVGTDKGCLRLQFTSSVSQKFWGKKQKYKSLKLKDTTENRAVAEDIAYKARQDIYNDNIDATLNRKNPQAIQKSALRARLLIKYVKIIEKENFSSNFFKKNTLSKFWPKKR